MRRIKFYTKLIVLLVIFTQLGACGKGGGKATPDEMFLSAQQLQQEEKFDESIKLYRKITAKHQESRQSANSQFMIGYIYANHLRDTTKARIELNRFLDEYATIADSGLIEGAKFELKYMGKAIDEIPGLSELGQADSEGGSDSENQ